MNKSAEKPSRRVSFVTPNARTNLSSSSKRVKAAFKSPLRLTNQPAPAETTESLQEEIARLQTKSNELDVSIAAFTSEGFDEEELQEHIKKLHEYNEMKDVGQMLLGKLAVERGATTKELYEEYGLNLDD